MKTLLATIKKCSVFFLLVGSAFLFAGCSSKPSEGDGNQAIQNQINQDSQGRIKLVEFHKTNGQLAEVNAVKVYNLEFVAEIEFTSDCKWSTGLGGIDLGFRTIQLANKSLNAFAQFVAEGPEVGAIVKQGQRVKIYGAIQFEKKENGWSVDQVKLTKYIAENAPPSATGSIPSEQSKGAGNQSQTEPTLRVPAIADKEALEAMADVEREYMMTLNPRPDSGELQPVVGSAGFSSIRFIKFDAQQKTVKALIKENGYWVTNSITLSGEIDGGKLTLHGNNDLDAVMVFALQQSYRKITGQFKSGQSAGTVEINVGDSYLLDADPKITTSLTSIKFRGNDICKSATFTNNTYHFPASSPLNDNQYVYVPGMVMPLNDSPKDKRILLFQKPSPSSRVVPIYCMDRVVRKVSPEELERLIKEQTGKSVAAIISENEAATEKAASVGWAEFDHVTPKTPQIEQAINFTIQGINLGEKLSEVKIKLPNLQPVQNTNSVSDDDVEKEGHWRTAREQGLPAGYGFNLWLRDGRIYHMQIGYSLKDADKLGGWEAILNGLKEKFGEPDATSQGDRVSKGKRHVSYGWTIPGACRSFSFVYSDAMGFVTVSVVNTKFSTGRRPGN